MALALDYPLGMNSEKIKMKILNSASVMISDIITNNQRQK
jgi:hypothetical protein